MISVDPLLYKLEQLVASGYPNPLDYARQRFGSPEDLGLVASRIRVLPAGPHEIVVDLTPFERFIRPGAIDDTLVEVARSRSLTFLLTQSELLTAFGESAIAHNAAFLVFDDEGQYLAAAGDAARTGLRDFAISRIRSYRTLQALRRATASERLLGLLSPRTVEFGLNTTYPKTHTISGRRYIRMPNRMLVSCYLNTKRIFDAPDRCLLVSYEATRALFDSFRRSVSSPCDLLVAPNNTALMVASGVHAITQIPLCVIDKMGPIPTRHLTKVHTSVPVAGKRVALVVEVSATGSEIDRTVQYLSYRGAVVERVICCYNLDVGRPLLCDSDTLVDLCQPKDELGYVYRSE